MSKFGRGLGYIAGGLLAGVGEGLAERGRGVRLREAALAELQQRHQLDLERDELKHQRDVQRDETEFERESSLLHGTVTGPDGRVTGITRAGAAVDTGATEDAAGQLTAAQRANAEEVRQARKILAQYEQAADNEGVTLAEYINRRSSKNNPLTGLPEPDYGSDVVRIARLATQHIPGERDAAAGAWAQKLYGVPGDGDASGEDGAAPAAKSPKAAQGGQYKTAEEVRKAYKDGSITRDEAARILRDEYGYD